MLREMYFIFLMPESCRCGWQYRAGPCDGLLGGFFLVNPNSKSGQASRHKVHSVMLGSPRTTQQLRALQKIAMSQASDHSSVITSQYSKLQEAVNLYEIAGTNLVQTFGLKRLTFMYSLQRRGLHMPRCQLYCAGCSRGRSQSTGWFLGCNIHRFPGTHSP